MFAIRMVSAWRQSREIELRGTRSNHPLARFVDFHFGLGIDKSSDNLGTHRYVDIRSFDVLSRLHPDAINLRGDPRLVGVATRQLGGQPIVRGGQVRNAVATFVIGDHLHAVRDHIRVVLQRLQFDVPHADTLRIEYATADSRRFAQLEGFGFSASRLAH